MFRAALRNDWQDKCAITGLAVPELLRASHIKPWSNCETNAERLDKFDGVLLVPHYDFAFDKGFLTVDDEGSVILSPLLSSDARNALHFDEPLRVQALTCTHMRGWYIEQRGSSNPTKRNA